MSSAWYIECNNTTCLGKIRKSLDAIDVHITCIIILCLDKENSKLLSEIKSYRIARVTGSIYFSNNIVVHLQILLCFV